MATPRITRPSGVNDTGLPGAGVSLNSEQNLPIDIEAVIHHLAMRPREAREFVAGLAHAMIEQIDLITPDPDLEPTLAGYPHGARE